MGKDYTILSHEIDTFMVTFTADDILQPSYPKMRREGPRYNEPPL